MVRILLVGAAGALGALARYGIGTAIGTRSFPWATLVVNVLGSFLLGVVLGGPGATRWSETATTAVAVGFLGAFTTFSTFAFEATTLARNGRPGAAVGYAAASLALGLTAAVAGYTIART